MKEQDPSRFVVVPLGFGEEVERAAAGRQLGDLGLLAAEARGFNWETEGLRAVGRAQYNLKDFEGARKTWEAVRRNNPEFDLEANLLLGTVYERLGNLTESTLALDRALSIRDVDTYKRAEAFSLLARNAKTRWRQTWSGEPPDERRAQALRSGYLQDAIEAYSKAFDEDLDHFYSGLNALALLSVRNQLAAAMPEVWSELFDSDGEAAAALELSRERERKLAVSVEQSLQAQLGRLKRESREDVWAEIAAADLRFLTSNRPGRVAAAYRDALPFARDFASDAVRRQLAIYRDLGLFADKLAEVLKVVGEPPTGDPLATPAAKRQRVLIFTGHMVDAPGRERPRFPADKEALARQKIREAVEAELRAEDGVAFGIAGGASGGDILFHEVCEELGVPTRLYLALQPALYVKASVRKAGGDWVERFWRLHARLEEQKAVRSLSEPADEPADEAEYLPAWLRSKPDYNIWQRNNLWMLHNALAAGGDDCVTLIALWDKEATGDGAGGTSDLVARVERRGARTVVIDTRATFGL